MHLGKYCEVQNNEFMLCRNETQDPRFAKHYYRGQGFMSFCFKGVSWSWQGGDQLLHGVLP